MLILINTSKNIRNNCQFKKMSYWISLKMISINYITMIKFASYAMKLWFQQIRMITMLHKICQESKEAGDEHCNEEQGRCQIREQRWDGETWLKPASWSTKARYEDQVGLPARSVRDLFVPARRPDCACLYHHHRKTYVHQGDQRPTSIVCGASPSLNYRV